MITTNFWEAKARPGRLPVSGRLPVAHYISGILNGDRAVMGRTTSVIESELPSDEVLAEQILQGVLPRTGKSRRIGMWQMILDHRAQQEVGSHLERRRQSQALNWMRELISSGLQEIFQNASTVQGRLARLEHSVREGGISPSKAARELLGALPRFEPTSSNGSGSPPLPDPQC
jgi:putative protein kinase ArgK-like GTPase of G3E family